MLQKKRSSQSRGSNQGDRQKRQMFLETLEDRRLLAVGPQLIGIQPNDGDLLRFDDSDQIRDIAPRELRFRFDENQVFTQEQYDSIFNDSKGIQVTRSTLDGEFMPASVESDFGVANIGKIRFSATRLGTEHNGIRLIFSQRDFGGFAAPQFGVSDNRIDITLNVNANNETTAQELVDEINRLDASNDAVSSLIRAELLPDGSGVLHGDADIASGPINYSPLELTGANDTVIRPGFVGAGDTGNEVVIRFAETLPDDIYQIDIFGEGSLALRNATGEAFNDINDDLVDDGTNLQVGFDLDLGAQITAVVAQPVVRSGGALQQQADQVVVYFNDDDLDPTTVEDPGFYQLIFLGRNGSENRPTVENTDDVIFLPTDVAYNAALDAVLLTFEDDLDKLVPKNPGGPGAPIGQAASFRLRVGTKESLPLVPSEYAVPEVDEPGSSFDTALSLDGQWDTGQAIVVNRDETSFAAGQTFTVTDTSGAAQQFTFSTSSAASPNIELTGGRTAEQMATAIMDAINNVPSIAVTATTNGNQVLLDGDADVALSSSITALGLASQGIVISEKIVSPDLLPFDLPGTDEEPGHSQILEHVGEDAGDTDPGITQRAYNFRSFIGYIPDQGGNLQPSYNTITEAQKQRAREVFEIFSQVGGVQFYETEDEGLIVATGDLRVAGSESGPGNVIGFSGTAFFNAPNPVTTPEQAIVIMDNAENWSDEYGWIGGMDGKQSWFTTAMHEIGHNLGLGHTLDLPLGTVMGSDNELSVLDDQTENLVDAGQRREPVFPGDHDIVHLQHIHEPDSRDIDVYHFELTESGQFTAETIAERRRDHTDPEDLLDTVISVYQVRVEVDALSGEVVLDGSGQLIPVLDSNGNEIRDLISRNDDYFSEDSYVELSLRQGSYYVAVTAAGNDKFDPAITDTGYYGRSQGTYDLRLNFRPTMDQTITDADNPVDAIHPEIQPTSFDGDHDNVPGGVFNHWFQVAPSSGTEDGNDPRTVFVDKSAAHGGNGTEATPFNNLMTALNVDVSGNPLGSANPDAVRAGDILRIVGNPGDDGDIRTEVDNRAYELGFNPLGFVLSDGSNLKIPQDVTAIFDAGVVGKFRRSYISLGSSLTTADQDRSAGAIQVQGAPYVIDTLGNTVDPTQDFRNIVPLPTIDGEGTSDGQVHFTSYLNEELGLDTFSFVTSPEPGDWGGIFIRRDIDNADLSRFSYEEQGIFLDYISHADIRFGGGDVLVEAVTQVVEPIEIMDSRPTVSHNVIENSRDAAIGVSPDSFLVTNFHSPAYQQNLFTSDFERIGPDLHGNEIVNNTINGALIRITTPAGDDLQEFTVTGRLDDTDVVFVLKENLVIAGTPGGPFLETNQPSLDLVTVTPFFTAEGILGLGDYSYKLVNVDGFGNEAAPSNESRTATIVANPMLQNNSVKLQQLLPATGEFVGRRLYRSSDAGVTFTLVAEINQTDTTYIDDGTTIGGELDPSLQRLRPRLDASMVVDPNIILKLDGARLEVQVGAVFLAEGRDGSEIIMTSILDDRYGIGGTFDTANDGPGFDPALPNAPQPGQWGGLYLANSASGSMDHAVVAYGGGITRVEGTFSAFNVIEVQQADARIAHTLFEYNADGLGGQGPDTRFGRTFNDPSVIFVRGAQPVIIDNIFRDNQDPTTNTASLAAISINANALNHELNVDSGRVTGFIENLVGYQDNRGPLIVDNRLGGNELNGMRVRAETLTTASVWDDTTIDHVVEGTIFVPGLHTYGGLLLKSNPKQSLVVKLEGANAGFKASDRPLDITDRVGGILQIVGQPKSPVILTSLADDSVGSAVDPSGDPLTNTDAGRPDQAPTAGDWNTIEIGRFAHDRNVEIIIEEEARDEDAPGTNAIAQHAQKIGSLATGEKSSDENLRLGFEVQGFLGAINDVDVYSFQAQAGTEAWVDFDRTTYAFDPIFELVDGNDNVLMRSTNSYLENQGEQSVYQDNSVPDEKAFPMEKTPPFEGQDFWGYNPRDPGLRMILPGPADTTGTYYLRVRSAPPAANIQQVDGGLTSGAYQFQLRLHEKDEHAGSTIRYADIGYASTGITVEGQPTHSPLTGEAIEIDKISPPNVVNENVNNDVVAGAQTIGELMENDRGTLSVAGWIDNHLVYQGTPNQFAGDVDWYRFTVGPSGTTNSGNPDVPDLDIAEPLMFDIDYADGLSRPDVELAIYQEVPGGVQLVYIGRDSNVADDRPHPLEPNKVADLTRGSVGANDPLIGPVVLSPGTYYAVVSTDAPAEVGANPALRLSALNSILPATLPVFEPVPWFLHDVSMFVVTEEILPNFLDNRRHTVSEVHVVDPYTGLREVDLATFNYDVGDIDMRDNGTLNAFSVNWHEDHNGDLGVQSDANACIFLEVNDHTATTMNGSVNDTAGNCGITTYVQDPAGDASDGPDPVIAHPYTPPGTTDLQRIGYGINIDAMLFTTNTLLGVGRRGDFERDPAPAGVEMKQNLLFDFDPGSGKVKNVACATHQDPGPTQIEAWTNACLIGQIETGAGLTGVGAGDGVTEVNGFSTDWNIEDGDIFTLDDGVNPVTFEYDMGPQVQQQIRVDSTSQVIRDGYFFVLDNPTKGNSEIFQFDTGPVIQINGDMTGADVHGMVLQISGIHPDGNTSQTIDFEFRANPPGGNPVDTTNKNVAVAASDNAQQVAAKLRAIIDGLADNELNVGAAVFGNRVTLTGEEWAAVVSENQTTGGRQVISIQGSQQDAPVIDIQDVDRIQDGDRVELTLDGIGQGGALHTDTIFFRRTLPTDTLGTAGEPFDTDPGWNSVGSGNNGNNFGWSATSNAGGTVGELGGTFTRTSTARYLADDELADLTLDQAMMASGELDMTALAITDFGNSLNLGHFHSNTPTTTSLAFGINFADDPATPGTLNWQARLGANYSAPVALSLNNDVSWSYTWDPVGGAAGFGRLDITVGGTSQFLEMSQAERINFGTTVLDSFGFLGVVNGTVIDDLAETVDLWVDELVYTSEVIREPHVMIEPDDDEAAVAFKFREELDKLEHFTGIHQLGSPERGIADGKLVAIVAQQFLWTTTGENAVSHSLDVDVIMNQGGAVGVFDQSEISTISIEESYTADLIAMQVLNKFNMLSPDPTSTTGALISGEAWVGIDASFEGDRLNFTGDEQCVLNPAGDDFQSCDPILLTGPRWGDFRGVHGLFQSTATAVWKEGKDGATTGGVGTGHIRIGLKADDDLDEVMERTAAVINEAYGDQDPASASGGTLELTGVGILEDLAWLDVSGSGPGGFITGMANVNGTVFAVSDRGGLYTINPNLVDPGLNVWTNYIASSSTDLNGIEFSGLTEGPQNVEGGLYSDLLFGVTDSGRVYAFNTAGELQPIFANSANSIQLRRYDAGLQQEVALTDVRGLAFSTLDRNLFEFTPGVRQTTLRDMRIIPSLAGPPVVQNINVQPNPLPLGTYHFGEGHVNGTPLTYDYEGGAHGTLVSNEFSLVGYSGQDRPMLFFDYFLDTGAGDTFQAFISDNGAEKILVQTLPATNGATLQAQIPLDRFAGADHLRLHFDFSTGGNVGVAQTTGDELRAVEGQYLRDGDTFSLLSYEMVDGIFVGATQPNTLIMLPAGDEIIDDGVNNTTLTVGGTLPNGNTWDFTFEFDLDTPADVTLGNIAVPVQLTDSSQDVAVTLENMIPGATLMGHGAIYISGASTFAMNPAVIFDEISNMRNEPASFERFELEMGYTLVVPSSGAISDTDSFTVTDHNDTVVTFEFDYDEPASVAGGNERIFIEPFESAATVAGKMATAIQNSVLEINTHQRGERLNLEIDMFEEGVKAVTVNALHIALEGNVGTTEGSSVFVHEEMTRNQVANELNRIAEGNVYGPTIVVPSGASFKDDLWASGAAIREADWFAIGDGQNMSTFEFDSGIVLNVPSGLDLSDGVTVNFTDGTESRIFEFDKDSPGNVSNPTLVIPVTIDAIDTSWEVAQKLVDTINANNGASPLQLTAKPLDGARVLVRSSLTDTRAEVSTKAAEQQLSLTIPTGVPLGTPDLTGMTFEFSLEVFDALANSLGTTNSIGYDPAIGEAATAAAMGTVLDQLAGVPNGFTVSVGVGSTLTNPSWDITFPAGNDYAAVGINFPNVNISPAPLTLVTGGAVSEQQRLYFDPSPAALDYQFKINISLPDALTPGTNFEGTTAAIDWDATTADIEQALDDMANAVTGLTAGYAVAGGGTLATPWVITYPGTDNYNELTVTEVTRGPELQGVVNISQGGDFGPIASGITGVIPGRTAIEFEPSSFWRTEQVSDAIVNAINAQGLDVSAELKDFTTSHVRLNHESESNWEIVVCLNNPTYQPVPPPFPPSAPPTDNPHDNLCYYDPIYLPGGATSGVVSTEPNGPLKVHAADIDGDGDQDVVSSQFQDNTVRWYENDGNANFTSHVVSTDVDYAAGVFAVNLDGDGDVDIISASMDDDTIYWHENQINWFQQGGDIDGTTLGDNSGHAVSLSTDGLTVAIGEPFNDDNGLNAGQARVYQYDEAGAAWNQLGAAIPGATINDFSGSAVSLSGDGSTVVVGAWANDGSTGTGSDSGHAAIYRFNPAIGTWGQLGTDLDGEAIGDQSGFSVSLSDDGNVVAIGANFSDENGGDSGHVRVYDYAVASNTWSQRGLDIAGEAAADESGVSVSLSANGNTLAIGAHLNDGNGNESGHARVLEWNVATSTWDQVGADLDGGAIDDHAGWSVSLSDDGDTVAVGADRNDANGVDSGHARIYRFDGLFWNQLGNDIEGDVAGDQAGWSVSLSSDGETVAIGATGNDTAGNNSGQTRIYDLDTGTLTWNQRGLSLDGAAADDASGSSVSISGDGNTVAIGSPFNDASGADSGQARIYRYGRQFTQHVISTNANQARSVYAADVDGDGIVDVLSASRQDDKIAWYKNDGAGNFGAQQVITTNAESTHGVFAIDMDGDADMDVLSASRDDNKIAWYENDGNENFTEQVITTSALGAYDVFAIDVDGDTDIDVLSASDIDDTVRWYENDGSENFTEHLITTSMNGVRSVFAIDMDGDSDIDVMAASRYDDTVAWFENDGSQNFAPHVLTTGADGASSVYAADLNGDPEPDIIASSFEDDTVAWFEKDSTYQPQVPISPLTLEAPVGNHSVDVDNIKQHQDLLTLWYGTDVLDPGPFGFQDHTIPTESPLPLQDNQHEGAYLSNIQVGFVERGLAVTGSVASASPLVDPGGSAIAQGAYQLEIRRGSFSPLLAAPFIPMDTNDRLSQSYTLVIPAGSDVIDGQTFDLSDSVNTVRFEYDDTLIGVSAFEGVTAGNLRIPFVSEMEDWELARVVRDLINSNPVQSTISVAASLSNGVDGILFPDVNDADNERDLRILTGGTSGISSSNKINLFGAVYVVTDTNVLRSPVQEQSSNPDSNDTLATATATGISGFNSAKYVGQGSIGDNPNLPLTPGQDVDLFEVLLNENDELTVVVQSQFSSASLDTRVRIFDAAGNQRDVQSDPGNDLNFTYTPADPGLNTFYVGVSAVANDNYDPQVSESGTTGDVGPYRVELSFNAVGTTDFTAYEKAGDQNHFRDQGQILIHANTVHNSAGFGIEVDQEKRYGPIDGDASHPGGVRHLDELNDQDYFVTGVVVANNLVYRNDAGGIHISGSLNSATQSKAPVPFSRVINNTVYGLVGHAGAGTDVGIQVTDNASPTLLNNVVAGLGWGIQVDGTSSSTVVGGSLYQDNVVDDLIGTTEDFPVYLTSTDPLFVNPTAGVDNFYLAPSTADGINQAIDSSIGSLQERYEFNLVKAPMGISPSPILAPSTDVTGQERYDDPDTESPGGLGAQTFFDRGALDRADFSGPVAVTLSPRDNDADGIDENSGNMVIELPGDAVVPYFDIRLNDGEQLAAAHEGIGIEDTSVSTDKVIVRRDGQLLEDNVDYSFSYNGNNDTIRLTPLAGIWPQDSIYTISLVNRDQWSVVAPHWDVVNDGDQFTITDLAGNQSTFEFEYGYVVNVPQTLQIQVSEAGAGVGGIKDGDRLTVTNSETTASVVFEFDDVNDGQTNYSNGGDHVLVTFSPSISTQEDIVELIRAELADPTHGLALSPVNLGEGRLHLGTRGVHTVDLDVVNDVPGNSSLSLSGQLGGVEDGALLFIDDGTQVLTFEFDEAAGVDGSNVAVSISQSDTNEDIAETLVTEVTAAGLGLQPFHLGDGRVFVGGTINHQLTLEDVTVLSVMGEPGVAPELSLRIPTVAGVPTGIEDGEEFTISDGFLSVTFELNNTDVNPGLEDSDNTRIDFNNSSSVSQLANQIVLAIKSAGLNLDPVHEVGTAIIRIQNSTTAHTINAAGTSLEQLGTPGLPAATPVNLTQHFEALQNLEFDDRQIAVAMLDSLEQATDLAGVAAWAAGGPNITLTGVEGISDISGAATGTWQDTYEVANPSFISEIEDRAANPLKPNQLSGETKFTITLGSVSMDYGDAADGLGQAPQNSYPVLSDSDAAIHLIPDQLSETLWLGSRLDRDSDGQSLTLEVAGDATAMVDGEQFVITKGTRSEVFEFETASNGVAADTTPINIVAGQTAEQIAETIATAINGANLGMFVQSAGSGKLLLGTNYGVDAAGAPTNLSVSTVAGTGDDIDGELYTIATTGSGVVASNSLSPATLSVTAANVVEGDQVTISNGLVTATFEFDDSATTTGVTFGNFAVPFTTGDTDDTVAAALSAAMNQATVDANLELNLNPLQSGADVEISGDDEDGVSNPNDPSGPAIGFLSPYVQRDIVVTASSDGLLDAWIDFNRDGDWDDVAEQIFASQQLLAGANTLTIDTPFAPDFKVGDSFARFRISSTGGLTPTGLVADGEVEDYAVDLVPGTPPVPMADPGGGNPALFATLENDQLPISAPGVSLLDNDSDADGDDFRILDPADPDNLLGGTFTITSTGGATVTLDKGFESVSGAGVFTYDPTSAVDIQALPVGQTMEDTFTYNLVEALPYEFVSQTEGTVTITVTGQNDVPVANLATAGAVEDGPAIQGQFNGSDVDSDDDQTTLIYNVTASVPVGQGTLVNNGDGTFNFSPGSGFQDLAEGATSVTQFSYTAKDQHNETSVPGTGEITITGVNDTPLAGNDTYVVDQDDVLDSAASGTVNSLFHNDVDVDNGDTLSLKSLNGSSLTTITTQKGATLTVTPTGEFVYDPTTSAVLKAMVQNQWAEDVFNYEVEDSHGEVSTGIVTIVVSGVNNAPEPVDDTYQVDQDEVLTTPQGNLAGVLANDTDPDLGDSIVLSRLQGQAFAGGSATVTGTSAQGAAVTLNLNGTLTYDPTISGVLSGLNGGQQLVDTFTYAIVDDFGLEGTATVSVTVLGVNKGPTTVDDFIITGVNEDTQHSIPDSSSHTGVLLNDSDPEGDAFSVTGVNGAAELTGTTTQGAAVTLTANGGLTYNPTNAAALQALPAGGTTVDTFTYTATDVHGGSNEATVSITVDGINDLPVAGNDTVDVPRNATTAITILSNDNDVDGVITLVCQVAGPTQGDLQLSVATDPGCSGSLVDISGNTVNYTPDPGISGPDQFTYRVKDDTTSGWSTATATVVIEVNDPPHAEHDVYNSGTGVTDPVTVYLNAINIVNVLANDTDSDGTLDASSVTVASSPVHGTAVAQADGTIYYTPAVGTPAGTTDTFTYQVQDDDGAWSNVANVNLLIQPDPTPWQNKPVAEDVNDDGTVSPLDALIGINAMNANTYPGGTLPVVSGTVTPPPFYDVETVTTPGILAPLDVLVVINWLNDNATDIGSSEGEGEEQGEWLDQAVHYQPVRNVLVGPVTNDAPKHDLLDDGCVINESLLETSDWQRLSRPLSQAQRSTPQGAVQEGEDWEDWLNEIVDDVADARHQDGDTDLVDDVISRVFPS
jgi:VCBS repeat-containing protein